ncbi:hypothetical protein HI914_04077 [Erysiphe necator]|nr:hypothetical protein HI914_04077 [Erysiphe necator]
MRIIRTSFRLEWPSSRQFSALSQAPIVKIIDGTFYRRHPNSTNGHTQTNKPLFANLNFELKSFPDREEHWAIVGPSSSGKTTLLEVLNGEHICVPPTARSFPFLDGKTENLSRNSFFNPQTAIKLVKFDSDNGLDSQIIRGAYLSARYETRRENEDFCLRDYLEGNTELNPMPNTSETKSYPLGLRWLVGELGLIEFMDMPVLNLSNGQKRRARIAKALLKNPDILLLDEPFAGLDPITLLDLKSMLYTLVKAHNQRLLISLRPQDQLPQWITHAIYLSDGECHIKRMGPVKNIFYKQIKHRNQREDVKSTEIGVNEENSKNKVWNQKIGRTYTDHMMNRDHITTGSTNDVNGRHDDIMRGEPIIEMEGVKLEYPNMQFFGHWPQKNSDETSKIVSHNGLWWTVRRGERWGIFGPNGSGKTTLLSLITSDHPQTYALPIKLFGQSRLPEPGKLGISIFQLQAKIGHSSPELHAHMPRSFNLRQVLESAWSDTPQGSPNLNCEAQKRIDAFLRWFEYDLCPKSTVRAENFPCERATYWADKLLFGKIPSSSQKIAMFLRAIIKEPDIIILDEAFSCLDDVVRNRCKLFLEYGERRRLLSDTTSMNTSSSTINLETDHLKNIEFGGLKNHQVLLCVSHDSEEVPNCIKKWIYLPSPKTKSSARFGHIKGSLKDNWNNIWGI